MATPTQKAEEENCLIAKIGSGSTANVWLSIPRTTANSILEAPTSSLSEEDRTKAYHALCDALQATKVAVPFASDQIYDLSDEITVLQDLTTRNLKNATKILNFDRSSPHMVWFTTELLNGGTLEQFLAAKQHFTENFAWNCVRQITESILAVYFSTPQYYQGDVRPANLMFRVRREGGQFPDLVLIDFGQAKNMENKGDVAFFDRQREDVKECFRIIVGDREHEIQELRSLAVEFVRLYEGEMGTEGNANLEKMVRKAHTLALERVGKYDLSSDVVMYFAAGLRTEDGRVITMKDILSCQVPKAELEEDDLY